MITSTRNKVLEKIRLLMCRMLACVWKFYMSVDINKTFFTTWLLNQKLLGVSTFGLISSFRSQYKQPKHVQCACGGIIYDFTKSFQSGSHPAPAPFCSSQSTSHINLNYIKHALSKDPQERDRKALNFHQSR